MTVTDHIAGRAGWTPPPGLREVVERHGQFVAGGDHKATLNDFRPDRVGQVLSSADLPQDLVGSELLSLELQDDGLVAAHIRYTSASGSQTVLRSRWVELPDLGWKVSQVRNVPDTPPDTGTAGPAESGLDTPHWQGLREGVLRMQQCAGCEQWIWAPRPLCPACHSWDLRWPELPLTGTVFSWTRTWQAFHRGLVGHVPFVVVLVEVTGAGGRRLLGVLRDGDGADVQVGAPLVGDIEQPAALDAWPVLRWSLA